MRARRGRGLLLVLAAMAGTALALVAVQLAGRRGERDADAAASPAPVAVEPEPARAAPEQDLRARDATIAELRAEVARLRARLDERELAASAARDEAPPDEAPAPETDPVEDARRRAAAAWLRRVLPDRYADLSEEEAAMLMELDLRGVELADVDLAQIAALERLRSLGLRGTAVTDVGLAHLAGMERLTALDLRGTAVTAEGLRHLPRANLEFLELTGTQVRGADLHLLPPLPELKNLKLNWLELDDSAIEWLGTCGALRHVELDRTALTIDGLKRLLQLHPQLERVELRDTQVGADELAAFARGYPGCEFVLDSGPIPAWR